MLECRLHKPSLDFRLSPEQEDCMCTIPVFYATTHGQTRRIAERDC